VYILLFKPYDPINYFIPVGSCIKISSGYSRKSPAGCRKLSEFPEKPLRGCDKLSGAPEKSLQGCNSFSGKQKITCGFQPGFSRKQSGLSAQIIFQLIYYFLYSKNTTFVGVFKTLVQMHVKYFV